MQLPRNCWIKYLKRNLYFQVCIFMPHDVDHSTSSQPVSQESHPDFLKVPKSSKLLSRWYIQTCVYKFWTGSVNARIAGQKIEIVLNALCLPPSLTLFHKHTPTCYNETSSLWEHNGLVLVAVKAVWVRLLLGEMADVNTLMTENLMNSCRVTHSSVLPLVFHVIHSMGNIKKNTSTLLYLYSQ